MQSTLRLGQRLGLLLLRAWLPTSSIRLAIEIALKHIREPHACNRERLTNIRDHYVFNRGRVFVNRGRIFRNRGSVFINRGRSFINRGRSFRNRGRSFVDRGRSFVNRGCVFTNRGRSFVNRERVVTSREYAVGNRVRCFYDRSPAAKPGHFDATMLDEAETISEQALLHCKC